MVDSKAPARTNPAIPNDGTRDVHRQRCTGDHTGAQGFRAGKLSAYGKGFDQLNM